MAENSNNSDLSSNKKHPNSAPASIAPPSSLLSCQISLMVGAAQGFSAILLPQLLDPKSSEHITQSQASWIGKY
nr:fatty acid synthase [Kerria lacca]